MKKIVYAVFSLLLLTAAIHVNAQNDKENYKFKKEKDISKTYTASGNKLSIDNSFGNVKYIAWDKNEIKIDVHIEVLASSDDFAQKVLDAIKVTDKQNNSEIEFKTEISNNNNHCKNCNSNMHINYEIHLPVSVALTTSNTFGNTEIPDYTGPISISSKFGDLIVGTISNLKDITVEFGKADLKNITNLDAEFKFSKININNVAGDCKLKFEFCDSVTINLAANLNSLSLHESYSTVNLKPGTLSAHYSVKTSFGSFTDRTSAGIKRTDSPERYGPDSEKTYEGQSGSGGAKIELKSSFGNIILGEPTAEDLKAMENKTKSKGKKTKEI